MSDVTLNKFANSALRGLAGPAAPAVAGLLNTQSENAVRFTQATDTEQRVAALDVMLRPYEHYAELYEAYQRGHKRFIEDENGFKKEHPWAHLSGTALGTVLGVGAVSTKLLQSIKEQGTVWKAINMYRTAQGARKLENALRTREFKQDINAGQFSNKRLNEINAMRQREGAGPLTDPHLVWTPRTQQHLWERRVQRDKVNPAKVAQWQRRVFFGPDSKLVPNPKYPGDTAMQTPDKKYFIKGFVSNDGKKTIGTSVFKTKKPN